MLFVDYYFEVGPNGNMILDRELTLEKLNWSDGDHFEVKLFNNRIVLYKIKQGEISKTTTEESIPPIPVY